jgi:hypothetical protein
VLWSKRRQYVLQTLVAHSSFWTIMRDLKPITENNFCGPCYTTDAHISTFAKMNFQKMATTIAKISKSSLFMCVGYW